MTKPYVYGSALLDRSPTGPASNQRAVRSAVPSPGGRLVLDVVLGRLPVEGVLGVCICRHRGL